MNILAHKKEVVTLGQGDRFCPAFYKSYDCDDKRVQITTCSNNDKFNFFQNENWVGTIKHWSSRFGYKNHL